MEVDDIIDIDKKTGRIKVTAAKGADVVRLVNNGKVENSYMHGSRTFLQCNVSHYLGYQL